MDNLAVDILPGVQDRQPSSVVPNADCSTPNTENQIPSTENAIKLYRRRWMILAIFSLVSMMNEVIWISLSSVANIVQSYYRVSYNSVNWLAMIFSSMYINVMASVYVLNKYGLKVTIVTGALCNAIASVLRIIGYHRNGFPLAFVGNIFGGVGQSFLMFIPPTLSAVWFGENERARASAIGMMMNFIGVAVGFLMGSMFIPNSHDFNGVVKNGMFLTLLIQAVVCGVLLILSFIFIQNAPPTPPTQSQSMSVRRREVKREIMKQGKAEKSPKQDKDTVTKQNEETVTKQNEEAVTKQNEDTVTNASACHLHDSSSMLSSGFFKNWKMLMSHLTFHLLTQAYALYFALFVTVSTLLNQMTIQYFPGKEKLIGMMGFTSVLLGVIAMMLAGVWIDKTHRYKLLSVAVFISCTLSFFVFILVLKYSSSFPATFICFCVYGFFSYPYLSFGLEHVAEIMFPIKESILSFILLFASNIYGIVLTCAFGYVIDRFGTDVAGYIITGVYFVGLTCVVFVRGELKRLNADNNTSVR